MKCGAGYRSRGEGAEDDPLVAGALGGGDGGVDDGDIQHAASAPAPAGPATAAAVGTPTTAAVCTRRDGSPAPREKFHENLTSRKMDSRYSF